MQAQNYQVGIQKSFVILIFFLKLYVAWLICFLEGEGYISFVPDIFLHSVAIYAILLEY